MKILSATQIREWDKASMTAEGISPLMLMERAASACADWIISRYKGDTPFLIVCGTGNNGGDGLAIARLLSAKGYTVAAFVVRHTQHMSPDCKANFEALKHIAGAELQVLQEGSFITDLPESIVIIDALFGTGINRGVEGYPAEFISRLNKLPNVRISIDLPSGLPADALPVDEATIVAANHTLTFQQYKRSMLHREGGRFCGQVQVLDIGLSAEFQDGTETYWHTLDRSFIQRIYRPRKPFTHKGTYGTAFMIGGSYGMIGAVVLATKAAGRAGAGKVRTLLPACGYEIAQISAADAMCLTCGDKSIENISGWETAEGIGVGPGMGKKPVTVAALEQFMKAIQRPVVIDADALNILADHPDWLQHLPSNTILTPHPKELERLFGKTGDSLQRLALVRKIAMELRLIIVAKNTHTLIALPDGRCYYNTTGNAGLATGGSGDVLCGMITGLLAQGYSPEQAALLGVFLHGVAADKAVGNTGMEAMVAGDIVENIGAAYLSLADA